MREVLRIAFGQMILLLVLVLGISSCKDKPDPEPKEIVFENGVLVLNEGNFQAGNASLSFVSLGEDTVYNNVFEQANDRPLGDVGQSMVAAEGKIWVVVNNSGKLEGLDPANMQSQCTIAGLSSPRYLLPLGNGNALVTDLYAAEIAIVDLENCRILGQLPAASWTEEILMVNNEVWVAQMGTDKLLRFGLSGLNFIDSLRVGKEPNSLVLDGNGQVWVLCSGGLQAELPQLRKINPQTLVQDSFLFADIQQSPSRLNINAQGNRLFWLNDGLYEMDVAGGTLPVSASIPSAGHNWYGLSYDAVRNQIWMTDAKDYQRRGWLHRYDGLNFQHLDSFQVGVIPNALHFLP